MKNINFKKFLSNLQMMKSIKSCFIGFRLSLVPCSNPKLHKHILGGKGVFEFLKVYDKFIYFLLKITSSKKIELK